MPGCSMVDKKSVAWGQCEKSNVIARVWIKGKTNKLHTNHMQSTWQRH